MLFTYVHEASVYLLKGPEGKSGVQPDLKTDHNTQGTARSVWYPNQTWRQTIALRGLGGHSGVPARPKDGPKGLDGQSSVLARPKDRPQHSRDRKVRVRSQARPEDRLQHRIGKSQWFTLNEKWMIYSFKLRERPADESKATSCPSNRNTMSEGGRKRKRRTERERDRHEKRCCSFSQDDWKITTYRRTHHNIWNQCKTSNSRYHSWQSSQVLVSQQNTPEGWWWA